MSIHRSLKTTSGSLNQHRNVLKRAERIEKLAIESRFEKGTQSPLGIVKVRSIKAAVSKKKKAEGEGEAAATTAAAAPAGKAAAPAAKAAAPAAKGKK